MAEARIPLEDYGVPSHKPHVVVSEDHDPPGVWLGLEPEEKDGSVEGRLLRPDEAEALAATLVHFAKAQRRRFGRV